MFLLKVGDLTSQLEAEKRERNVLSLQLESVRKENYSLTARVEEIGQRKAITCSQETSQSLTQCSPGPSGESVASPVAAANVKVTPQKCKPKSVSVQPGKELTPKEQAEAHTAAVAPVYSEETPGTSDDELKSTDEQDLHISSSFVTSFDEKAEPQPLKQVLGKSDQAESGTDSDIEILSAEDMTKSMMS